MPRLSRTRVPPPGRHRVSRSSQVITFFLTALIIGSALVNAPLIIHTVRDINLAAWSQSGPLSYQGYDGILGKMLAASLDMLMTTVAIWLLSMLRTALFRGWGTRY